MDITYIPLAHGFVYLAAVVDSELRGSSAARQIPGDPATDFVTLKAEYNHRPQALAALRRLVRTMPKKQVLVFVHGFNNHFEDAVFRFAQIVHDSGAQVVPVLFTWPSKGSVFAYGYDHESASYSRDALEGRLARTRQKS